MTDKSALASKPYGNCYIYSPEGILLCCCTHEKINWYLDRKLASVTAQSPLSITLNFKPKGNGHQDNEYELTPKENKCVVCGNEEELSKHHIVPKCYRKNLPDSIKNHASHDVLLLCPTCHRKYERFADKLKNDLAIEYKAPLHNKVRYKEKLFYHISGLAYTLFKYGQHIPEDKRKKLEESISRFLKKSPITDKDIKKLAEAGKRSRENYGHGEIVAKRITDFEPFIIRWRKHFVFYMKPKFLPLKWRVDYPVRKGK